LVVRLLYDFAKSGQRGDAELTNIPLNAFVCQAMTAGYRHPEFALSQAPYPLAIARLLRRRCLIAATCAILDTTGTISTVLFGQSVQRSGIVRSAIMRPLYLVRVRWIDVG
jgi:hypothetical protein